MTSRVLDRLQAWEAAENDPHLEKDAIALVQYLGRRVFCDYEPAGMRPFLLGLEKWLDNLPSEDDQKTLVSLLAHIFYAGRSEFESLYRTATTNIQRWLVETQDLDITCDDLDDEIQQAMARTWLCPVTDSLRINSFLKVNGLKGHDHRPHWRSLAEFGDVGKINAYIKTRAITHLVLLEDFVGSGTQAETTIDFALSEFANLNVAFCPLIICPAGHDLFEKKASSSPKLSYLPALILPEEAFLKHNATANEPPLFARARSLINTIQSTVNSQTPFGYKQTGALTVMFSNCPDNTLAIFREEGTNWNPLFPRIWRPE